MGSPSLQSTARLQVTVQDADDSNPSFSATVYTVTVAEDPGDGNVSGVHVGK